MSRLEDIQDYYSKLLPMQYREKPIAVETIKMWVKLFDQNDIIGTLINAFHLDSDNDYVLDILGAYVGVDRYVNDITILGTNRMDNDLFREIIKLKVTLNHSNASYEEVSDLLFGFFGVNVVASFNTDMTVAFFATSEYITQVALAALKDILPVPLGVSLTGLIYLDNDAQYFGFTGDGEEGVIRVGFTADGEQELNDRMLRDEDIYLIPL